MAEESSASRSARVKFQLRDKKGRWIEMGRGVKWYSPRLGREVSGTVVNTTGRNAIVDITSEPAGKDGTPQQVSIRGSDIEVIENKADIDGPAPQAPKQTIPTEKAKLGEKKSKGGVATLEKPKADEKKGSQSGSDKEDEESPEVEEPDVSDLEEVDLDEDLGEDNESPTDEEEDTSPTSVDDLEATIEELEAVVEEVASGDLNASEIDAKLAEEVYTVYGNDGKQYDLDVKKSDGKWNFRLKDAGAGETRALIPADDNDSVDAGAKLNAAMNPKTKAKATPAKPEEKAPEAKTAPAPEAATPDKPKSDAKITAPERRSANKQPKLDIKGIKNVKRNGRGDYESSDMTEALMDRLPVGTEISSDETKQLFIKVAPNRWAEPDGQWEARELKDVDFLGEGDDTIYLPGGDSNTTDAAEIENLTAILDKNAEAEQERSRQYDDEIKSRAETEKETTPEAKTATSKTVKASKGTAEMLNWRMEMRPVDERGMAIDADNNVTVTDPAKAEQIFNEALGDTRGASNRLDVTGRADVEARDELLSLREELDVPDTRKGAARFTPARREESKEAPKTADPKDMSRDELEKEASDLHGMEAEPNEDGRSANLPRQQRIAALEKELDARPEEESQKADTAPENATEAAPAVIAQTDEEVDATIAALMAEQGIERTEPIAMEGEKYPPTRQQQDVIDAVMAGKNTKVQAMAGTGKTSTLEALSRRLEVQKKEAVYIAFNKTVQLEAAERMPKNVEARTGHSLANAWAREAMPFLGIRMRNEDPTQPFNFKGKDGFKKKAPKTSSKDIARVLGVGDNSVAMETPGAFLRKTDAVLGVKRMVNSFALSDKDEVSAEHLPSKFTDDESEMKLSDAGQTAMVGFAKAYWEDLSREDGAFRVTHDTYRKHWALSRPDLTDGKGGNKAGASVLYIDEAQDTPPVLAKVVADQNMQKVIVGDQNQAIYAFAENVDYLSQAAADIELPLNKSWRFGPVVADAGNRFLQLLGAQGRVVGGGGDSKRVVDMEDADAVLVRTNAGMVDAILEEAERGRRVSAPDGTRANLESLANTVQGLMDGSAVANPHDDLVGYKDWNEVLSAFRSGEPSVQTLTKLFDETNEKQLSKMTQAQHEDQRKFLMSRVNNAIDSLVEPVEGFDTLKKAVEGKRTFLEPADDFKGTENQRKFAVLNFSASLGKKRDPYAADASASWAEKQKIYRELGLKADGWRWDGASQRWFTEKPDTVSQFDSFAGEHDVMVSTAHKSKGLEWDRVRIGHDFPAPRDSEEGGVELPSDDEYKLAYVAATRAKSELDMGGLDYVYELTEENGGLPKTRKGDSDVNDAARVEDESVTPEAVPEPEDNTDVPATAAEASRYDDAEPAEAPASAVPEAPQAPEAAEVADESVPDAVPEAPETAPEPVESPEPAPAPAVAPESVEVPEESAPEDTTPDPATPVNGLNEDGLTAGEASYVQKLEKAISDGYKTGIGNIQALQERLDELYDRGAARQRGEDPDAVPEAAPEVKPVEDKEPATPEAEEEVVPEAEEVVEEAPEPTPETPVEAESEPVEVVEEPTEEGPQGDASDGEEAAEGGPTDLESFEATASELFGTFQDTQTTPRTPSELQDILDEEVYLLVGEDGSGYEFGLSVDEKGTWSYVLADEEGTELERYNVVTTSPEDAGQKAFERVNGSQESEAPEAITAPEAEEEVIADSDKVELDPADIVADPEVIPEPTPMPVVEDTAAPEEQTPVETPEVPVPETSDEGTAPAEPESAPVSAVVAKAGNYPDGTQIKDSRTSEVIEKTNGKWHVAGKPNKAADPAAVRTPVVSEMPEQPAESFVPFEGIDSVTAGDIVVTTSGAQAAVIGVRDEKLVVMPHNVPNDQKALRPNTVFADPSAITGINKFDTPAEAVGPAPETSEPKESAYTGNRGRADLTIMDGNGYETKIGDTVMTAIGQGEVISVRPSSGPQGSVQVRLANGDVKMFRSNKFTNAAGAESIVGDDPAIMEVGAQGTADDGRKFLVGKGNKPIYKGDRVELADGRVGTVSGIYAGVKSANIKMEDGATLRKKVSTLDALDYGTDTPETLKTENGVGLTGKVNLSNAINAARNKVALLNLTSAEKKEFEDNMMKKAAELQGGVEDDGSSTTNPEALFDKWVFDAIAELERKNDPLVAAGTPEAPSPLFFTVDDKGNVLELIKDEDDSLSIRLDGEWVDISDEDEFPTVYEQILRPATDDSVGAWDEDLEDNQELKLEDIADYIVE